VPRWTGLKRPSPQLACRSGVRRERLQPTCIYVSGYVSSTLFVVDGTTGRVMGAAAVGSSPWGVAITAALGRHLPFWDRHLHLVVLTHPDQDHLAGLVTVLERYDVDQVLAPALADDSATVHAWQETIAAKDIPQREAFAGQWLDLGGGARMSVLYPPQGPPPAAEEDDNSLVLKVSLEDAAFLLTGDIGPEDEANLVSNHADLRAPVLKVAHHGSRASTSVAFLAAVEPLTAVISVGEDNTYGLPSPETLDRLGSRPVFRTDRHGDVEMSTDGERQWVRRQRNGEQGARPVQGASR